MTVAVQTPISSYTGNGVTTAFSFGYYVAAAGDLVVMVDGVVKALTTDYTLTGIGSGSGGTCTFVTAPASGADVVLYRDTDLLRETDYQDNGDLLAAILNGDFDRIWLALQETITGAKLSPRAIRAPIGETLNELTDAASRAGKILSFNATTGQPEAVAPTSGTATDLAVLLASTDATEGADMIGATGRTGATLADFLWSFTPVGADKSGATSSRTVIVAADVAAAAAGQPLFFPAGTYLIDASYDFTAPVVMAPGAKLKTSASTVYLKFGAGFQSGLYYCLDTDGPTQFLKTEAIYPQWFGATGLVADDQSVALTRAFRAARGCVNGADAFSDARYGCATVRFVAQGQYRCSNVPVYCGTIIEGDWQGSLTGSCIVQIGFAAPALRIMPKNYGLDNTVLNNGVGQNVFRNIGFRSETAATTFDGEPLIYFMSPAQATTYLGIAGDTAGTVGHIDTMFVQCWIKDSNPAIVADEGMLWVHLRDCTFDVCWRGVWHKGTARGRVNSYNNIYYGCMRGALTNETSDTTVGVSWHSSADQFKSGTPGSATTGWRRALNYNPSAQAAGSFIKMVNPVFERTDSLFATRVGGSIFAKFVDTVDITGLLMKDPDSLNNQKAIAIQDGVKHLRLQGTIISDSLSSYATSRMVAITQSTQALTDTVIDLQISNTSASTIESAIYSDFALTGVDTERTYTVGNFTNRISALITGKTKQVATVASGASIILPPDGDTFIISGTTGIGTIVATGWAGKTVRLIFQGALTVTDGSNLRLAGNFVTTADDVLTLTCDGVTWYEVARSAN